MGGLILFFASNPSVYTLPGTWETQPEVLYDPTLLIMSASVVFLAAAIASVISIKRSRKRV
jgi:hypothetical protein|tara:strand:- start:11 stop:193 length:183 start_codon:yes stop_codon:yes gene_type:complete